MMGKHFLVFQHNSWEGPGLLLRETAQRHRVNLKVVRVWEEPIPALDHFDALLVLGGTPNIEEEAKYPFLVREKAVIRRSLAENRPYLGICLGHQLLAEALGGKVGRNHRFSVGFTTGYQTHFGHAHPAFQGLPDDLTLFKWHAQAVQEPLPRHLEILATSKECAIEAISVTDRPHLLGVQFDNHAADPADVGAWLGHDGKWLDRLGLSPADHSVILNEAMRLRQKSAAEFELLFANFLRLIENA
jgi:GMP synthase-like glutamine amidotransferase